MDFYLSLNQTKVFPVLDMSKAEFRVQSSEKNGAIIY